MDWKLFSLSTVLDSFGSLSLSLLHVVLHSCNVHIVMFKLNGAQWGVSDSAFAISDPTAIQYVLAQKLQ